jgi:hypothetical protein
MNDEIEALRLSHQLELDRVEVFKQRWIDQININEGLELQIKNLQRQIRDFSSNQSMYLTSDAAVSAAIGV